MVLKQKVKIPLIGASLVLHEKVRRKPKVNNNAAAGWIPAKDKEYAIMASKVYSTTDRAIPGWKLVWDTERIAVYKQGTRYTVVLRGTQDRKDLLDDVLLTTGVKDVSLVNEASDTINYMKSQKVAATEITVTGHSLGGYAAQVVSEKFKTRCVAFNPAASSVNPPKVGPGKELSTVYHIVGDLISSHPDPSKNNVVRIDLGYKFHATIGAHGTENFLQREKMGGTLFHSAIDDTKFKILTPKEEDALLQKFVTDTGLNEFISVGPIPGALRAETSNGITQEPGEADFARGGLLISHKVTGVDGAFEMEATIDGPLQPLLRLRGGDPEERNLPPDHPDNPITNPPDPPGRPERGVPLPLEWINGGRARWEASQPSETVPRGDPEYPGEDAPGPAPAA
jgi:hypothetical protein